MCFSLFCFVRYVGGVLNGPGIGFAPRDALL